MRRNAFFRKPAPVPPPASTVEEAAAKLAEARTTTELQDAWGLHAEHFDEGHGRDRLRDVFTRQLRSFGAMQG